LSEKHKTSIELPVRCSAWFGGYSSTARTPTNSIPPSAPPGNTIPGASHHNSFPAPRRPLLLEAAERHSSPAGAAATAWCRAKKECGPGRCATHGSARIAACGCCTDREFSGAAGQNRTLHPGARPQLGKLPCSGSRRRTCRGSSDSTASTAAGFQFLGHHGGVRSRTLEPGARPRPDKSPWGNSRRRTCRGTSDSTARQVARCQFLGHHGGVRSRTLEPDARPRPDKLP
jgi:hypothetical protein